MHPQRDMEFEAEAVKVTWCACERCNAIGPRQMTVVRNRREYSVTLRFECCAPARGRFSPHAEDED